jgi:enoyl-CoA hydratase/carnithine racemase
MDTPTADESGVLVEREGDRWTFVLDRATKANALSPQLVETLIDGVAQAHAAGASVLAFRGNGRNFSAGFDFTGYESQSEGDLLMRFVRIETLLQSIANSPCLTVGFAHGRNFGAGVDLFAACRWRVAAPDATFRMPGLGFGLVLGTRRFASIVGADSARSILEGLGTFDATSARDMKFVTRIVDTTRWSEALASAQRTADSLAPEARARLYRTLHASTDDADMADLVRSASVPGLKERIARYLARRP